MKIILALLFVCALGCTQAQLNTGLFVGLKTPFAGLSPGQFFQTIVIQSEAQKLLANPDLPEDLRQRVLDTMANSEQGFNNCSTTATLPWMQIRCAALQLQLSKNELKAIDDEATARAAASAAAAAATQGSALPAGI